MAILELKMSRDKLSPSSVYNAYIYIQADMAILELKMSRDKIEQHKKKVLGTMERNRYSALFYCIYLKKKVLIYMYIC